MNDLITGLVSNGINTAVCSLPKLKLPDINIDVDTDYASQTYKKARKVLKHFSQQNFEHTVKQSLETIFDASVKLHILLHKQGEISKELPNKIVKLLDTLPPYQLKESARGKQESARGKQESARGKPKEFDAKTVAPPQEAGCATKDEEKIEILMEKPLEEVKSLESKMITLTPPPLADYIAEDSLLRKIIACIPLLGIISSVKNELSLKGAINENKDPQRIIRRIEVKNHYKIASIMRELLTLALVVAIVASGILSVGTNISIGIIVTAAVITACFVGVYGYKIHQNKQSIIKLMS